EIWRKAKDFLARLVLFDVNSARNQDPQKRIPFDDQLPSADPFELRTPKSFRPGPLSALRDLLRTETLQLVDYPLINIDGPTGSGKTQAYLQLAEEKVRKFGYDKIVIALPMISILEQVVRDYLSERVAQIWNYLSQYKADEYVALE